MFHVKHFMHFWPHFIKNVSRETFLIYTIK
nr:MAG TPA: hypothetical protein [Caudoviricetes sp.]